MKVDTKGLQNWAKNLEGLANVRMEDFFVGQVKKGGLLTQRNVIKTTPVDTGNMRKSWYIDSHVKKVGHTYSINVFNNARGEATKGYPEGAPYPYYIEYGRRMKKNGQTIGYYPGRFILEKAQAKAERSLKRTIKRDFKAYVEGVLNK